MARHLRRLLKHTPHLHTEKSSRHIAGTMGQGGSKPEDIVAIAQQQVAYNPPLGPANPVSEHLEAFK